MEWISHRGESVDAPENTMSAFRLAVQRDTDGIETDIHLTKDGKLVCIHDSDTKRVAVESRIVEDSTFEELLELDFCNGKEAFRGEKIPLFRDLLALLKPGKRYFIEVKKDDEKVLAAMAEELNRMKIAPEQIVMISFHQNVVRLSKKYMPEVKTLWLTGFNETDGVFHPTKEECAAILSEIHADGIDAACTEAAFDAAAVAYLKSKGFFIAVWTIDEADKAARYIKLGVDAVTSNCAALMRDTLEK
ncbi:MAG: glycerophosphodiester phosphodiesterase [Lentisphaeria bacterium]|nr:glycerophosphodiester phosphodiesterase [Lentisphaeria bacterium]